MRSAPKLQTDTAEVHDTLVAEELENAPVPLGRNYQQMYRMLPGFAPPINSHSIPSNPSRSLEFTVNGTSDDQNNTRIDGVSTYNVQLPHVSSYVPTLEAIEEVNVVTSSMGAEQGLAGGAAINVRTKSGSNAFHGSGFEYFSNQDLKAWPMRFGDAALNTGKKPEASYNQYGGTVGGPIVENKAFFFVSYEGTRDHRVVDRTDTIPTPSMLRGDFSGSDSPIYDPLTGNADGTGRTQFQVFPGDPNYALCNTATNPQLPQHHSRGTDGSDRAADREPHSRQQHRPGEPQLLLPGPVPVRAPAGGHEDRLQREFQVQPRRYLRSPPFQRRRCPPYSVTRR